MKYLDEYQKFMRYKYGHHAFAIVLTLTILNMIISSAYDIQWAQTKEIESMVIMVIAVFYAIIMSIYRGAYFAKWENPIFYSIIFLFIGLMNFYLSFSPHTPMIVDGQLTLNVMMLMSGIVWLAIPITYFVKLVVEKRRDAKEDEEE